ncbi:MAG: sulfur reduction protein DsrS [Gammaproteobacteria bacterium SHHR-1]|uniref:sulfur reduction protein DsrS n=1 Tax=Magnetovirga frankeli TaxID=947516 RepID=UPI0012931027|nr:sulfur reduction protein DsrS [gamma proteobacterium SS-5]
MEEVCAEDSLRLNVLLASRPLAIRIQQSGLRLQALTESGEREIALNPNCREDLYLRRVRALISGHLLGSPGGYPVYIKRWTRMGQMQMRDESLEQLLLLAEPEAVMAAVSAPGLTDELARRAWWCLPDADNARSMLANPRICQGRMGPELAAYLLEHLPFETEPEPMIQSVALVLQEGLIDEAARLELWHKAARKSAYLVGFLVGAPDAIPLSLPPSPLLAGVADDLQRLAQQGNAHAAALARLLQPQGQAFLKTLQGVLKKPPNQEVLEAALAAVQGYLAALRPEGGPNQDLIQLAEQAEQELGQLPELVACQQALPQLRPQWLALRQLSGLGYAILRPHLGDSSAIGSLMRRKLEPVTQGLNQLIETLSSRP